MNTNRLSKSVGLALNTQVTNEALASQTYLSYAAWADNQGYEGVANFLFKHANEERNHMMKIIAYILKRGAEVHITEIPAPSKNPLNLANCFEKVFEHEVNNTKAIYKVVKLSLDEEDWATWSFMQWFVKEQIEEETLALTLLNKVKIAGTEKATGNALYAFDRDLEKAPIEIVQAQDVTATNP